ncbi:hypothetical protein GLW08_10805 [Pontibacillus yanchengensis]|uniref:Uncharacterized protein n=2 Tax=Pontibacillus yanchengensis TaxID=462910 RepID=A0ACC7VI15_9BACI|nr:hypothetical protein [Pontibacillus yanchengensis]MYL34356.1 hypothetical protein [Pontibacillus yanchengensis]MYL53824.1 hypothetical protein [Pontibacillus yanchengensis]
MDRMRVLQHIDPTDSFPVWDYRSIGKYEEKAAVYVFWDEKGYEQENRHDLYAEHSPVYIGKTNNLTKRIIQHLTHDDCTENFSTYFYHIDVYVFENLSKNHSLIQAMKEDKLRYENLADLYEVYLITRRFPWFNDTHNFYVTKYKTRLMYFSNDYHNLRRSNWFESEAKIEYGFKQIEKMAKELSLPVQTITQERWLRLEDFVDGLISRRKNKFPLRDNLIKYLQNKVDRNTFKIKTMKGEDKLFSYHKKESNHYYIASDALLYYRPSEQLISRLSKN